VASSKFDPALLIFLSQDSNAVALKVTGEPDSPADVAVTVFAPTVVPNVRTVDALPSAPVEVEVDDKDPPPAVTANVTLAPLTGLLFASLTITTKGLGSVVPTDALCPFPENRDMLVAGPAVPVALKVTGDPESPVDVAVTVFVPDVVPNVRIVDALPSAPVVAEVADSDPLPAVTANVTPTPLTGLLFASLTTTTKRLASVVPTVAL